jgi:hypothetical protein
LVVEVLALVSASVSEAVSEVWAGCHVARAIGFSHGTAGAGTA